MREYLRMHLQDRKLRRAFLHSVKADQLANLHVVWNLLLTIHLIDYVLVPPSEGAVAAIPFLAGVEPHTAVWIVVALLIAPAPVLLALDIYQVNLRIAGRASPASRATSYGGM